jgi:hypothetical protein
MAVFGRQLQFFGLVMLPLAIALQLAEKLTVGQMLVMATMGFSAFWIGRIVEGYARR